MKSYDEFKTIAYKNAIPHTVYSGGRSKRIAKGKAVPVRSHSSSSGFGGASGGTSPGPGGSGAAGGDSGGSGGGNGDGD